MKLQRENSNKKEDNSPLFSLFVVPNFICM